MRRGELIGVLGTVLFGRQKIAALWDAWEGGNPLTFQDVDEGLWDPSHLGEIVLSRVAAAEIGICGLGGLLFPAAAGSARGVHIVVGGDERHVLAPLAPGLIRPVPIAAARLLAPGERVALADEPCVVALDGEREIELFRPGHGLAVAFNPHGPNVVDIPAAIQAGAEAGVFVEDHGEPS